VSMSISQPVRIAVDAMGGDFAPAEVVRGAVKAARRGNVAITLVGPIEQLQAELATYDTTDLPLHLYHTDQFIIDGEPAARALRSKPEASVLVCTRLVKESHADAAVSMGHTGASMIAAHWTFGGLPGIQRPIAGEVLSSIAPQTIVLDLGANADCKPAQLLQFAAVGVAYARSMLGVEEPTVGLLANGSEPGKGTTQTRAAYNLLAQSDLNFVGNVEGWDLPTGRVNVVVCDGFVGNVILKYTEGLAEAIAIWLNRRLDGILDPAQRAALSDELLETLESKQRVGGSPLLGVNGVMVVGHGSSQASTVALAIEQARLVVERGLIEALETELAQIANSPDMEAS